MLRELIRPENRDQIVRDALVDPRSPPETLPMGGLLAIERLSPTSEPVLGVFVRMSAPAAIAEVESLGGTVGAVLDDYFSARIPLSALEPLSRSPNVVMIEAARALRMENDSSGRAIGIDQVRTLVGDRWEGATGEGAIVGIYDTGLDLRHDDFIDPSGQTRVVGLWDQTSQGTPPVGFFTGHYCSPSDIQLTITSAGTAGCRQRDFHGHGTHVAGTAAGDGSAGGANPYQFQFAGVAPGAELLIVNGGPGVFFENLIIDGLTWMRQEGLRLGRPVVANLSLGGQFGAHDGTRLYERMIDALSGPGFIVVVAAGNFGVNGNTTPTLSGSLIHARGIPTGTQTREFRIEIPPYSPNADKCNGNRVSISMWYEALDELTITVQRPSGSSASAERGTATLDENPAGRILIDNGSGGPNPENGDVEVSISLNGCGTSNVPETGAWRISVTPVTTGSGLPYDMWIWGSAGARPRGGLGFDNRLVVGSPATARRAITVGAFVTRLCWASIATANQVCYTQREETGDLARFSGGGPARDGRIKPEIVAPGLGVMSAHSSDASISQQRIAPDNVHAVREGTSMAAPQVTGAVAVMLGASPAMTPEDVKTVLSGTATQDQFTSRIYETVAGSQPSDWWGFGKLNVPQALLALSDTRPATLALTGLTAAPTDETLGEKGTLLPLLLLDMEARGFEPIDVTSIGFDVSGDDPFARILLARDDGNGALDPADVVVASVAAPLTAAARRVTIPFDDAQLRVQPFSQHSVFLLVELSGNAPNGAVFEAALAPQELHSRGVNSGAIDMIEPDIVAVTSGPASTTVLRSIELLTLSENPVRDGNVVFNFERPPTTAAVYTITGRRVVDLCSSGSLACGTTGGPTFTRWELRNGAGESVAPGVYLLIFTVHGETFREKLMILTGSDGVDLEQQP